LNWFWFKRLIFVIVVAINLTILGCLDRGIFAKTQNPGVYLFSGSRIQHLEQVFESRLQNSLDRIAEKFQGKIIEKIQTNDREKIIALTFDDGPDGKTTLQILDILEQYKVKATFFWVGKNLQTYPYVGRKIVRLGHAIGNHTWSHAYQAINRETTAQEIEETSALIEQITGVKPIFFRPPLGRLDNGLVSYAKERHYIIALWSINSEDSVGYPGVRTIAQNVVNRAHPGGIVLLHDAPWFRWKTVAALPTIIERLQAQGYRFVTLPELLALSQD
jgi:peptidoglycan-N-acetylglucosamine deacetylase